jgi:hypothetical protein
LILLQINSPGEYFYGTLTDNCFLVLFFFANKRIVIGQRFGGNLFNRLVRVESDVRRDDDVVVSDKFS